MPALIQQKVKFAAPAKRLFDIYFSAKEHALAIGSDVKIQKKIGAAFSVWDGYAIGETLYFEEGRAIVQTWRASDWDKDDPASILCLFFRDLGKGSELELVQTNVPDKHAPGLKKGWGEFYWDPLKKYLAGSK